MYPGSIAVIRFPFAIGIINPLNPPFLGDFLKIWGTPPNPCQRAIPLDFPTIILGKR
jgi:hypothetical protein